MKDLIHSTFTRPFDPVIKKYILQNIEDSYAGYLKHLKDVVEIKADTGNPHVWEYIEHHMELAAQEIMDNLEKARIILEEEKENLL